MVEAARVTCSSIESTSSRQWAMVAVLTLFGMLASVDKNLLTLLVASIRVDLGMSDVQIGLVIGVAFALSNVAISLPAGWMADRSDRRVIVATGVAIWSVMAMSCGMARSFPQLFLARFGVGLGEGISPPAAYSLIRDGVAPDRRGRAYSLYSVGASVGAGFSFLAGGALLGMIASLNIDHLPLVGPVRPWECALIIIGAAGLPLAALAFSFREPLRGDRDEATGFGTTLRLMRAHWLLLGSLAIFSTCQALLAAAVAAWIPAMLGRTYGLAPQQIGPILGVILIVAAPIGLLSAGALMDRLTRHGAGIAALVAAVTLMIAAALAPQTHDIRVFLVLQTIIILVSTVYLPVTSTVVARTLPPRAIGKAMAVFLMLQGIFGSGLGPLATALISDHVFAGDPKALNLALTTTAIVVGGVGALGALGIVWAGRATGAPSHPAQHLALEAELITAQERI